MSFESGRDAVRERRIWTAGLLVYLLIALLPTPAPEDLNIFTIQAETYYVITPDNRLVGWGYNDHCQLGGAVSMFPCPYIGRKDILKNAMDISANGRGCGMAVDKQGNLWGWGTQAYLLLTRETPFYVRPQKIMEDVSAVEVGLSHVLALKTDGTLMSWGYHRGQLGRGDGEGGGYAAPEKVMEDIISIYVCGDISFAVSRDHALYAWGPFCYKENQHYVQAARPVLIGQHIREVAYIGKSQFQFLTLEGEIFVLDIMSEDSAGNAVLAVSSEPIARNALALCQRGFLTADGSLWSLDYESDMAQSPQKTAARVIYAANPDTYVDELGYLHITSTTKLPTIPISLRMVSTRYRNLFWICIISGIIFPRLTKLNRLIHKILRGK